MGRTRRLKAARCKHPKRPHTILDSMHGLRANVPEVSRSAVVCGRRRTTLQRDSCATSAALRLTPSAEAGANAHHAGGGRRRPAATREGQRNLAEACASRLSAQAVQLPALRACASTHPPPFRHAPPGRAIDRTADRPPVRLTNPTHPSAPERTPARPTTTSTLWPPGRPTTHCTWRRLSRDAPISCHLRGTSPLEMRYGDGFHTAGRRGVRAMPVCCEPAATAAPL